MSKYQHACSGADVTIRGWNSSSSSEKSVVQHTTGGIPMFLAKLDIRKAFDSVSRNPWRKRLLETWEK